MKGLRAAVASWVSGGSRLWVSLGHTGRSSVVLGHPLNTLQHILTKRSRHVLSKLTILCWAALTTLLGRRLGTILTPKFIEL